jgi:DNA polymerase-4
MADDRFVLHIDMDAFFVAAECLRNTALQGKPLIIGGIGDRGVVSSCSYEARRFGIHSAMPMALAKRLCPHAIILGGDMEYYSKLSGLVTAVIQDTAPCFEKASIDEFYVDLTGMDRFFGCAQWSKELREKITRECGLPSSFGLSANKTVSKVATNTAKPNGMKQILHGEERGFLSPLPVADLPMAGQKTVARLRDMGVVYINTLQAMPQSLMIQGFGLPGKILWERAQGEDSRPVVPYQEQKSIGVEVTLGRDSTDAAYLQRLLTALTEKVGFRLRKTRKLTGCIAVKIRYSDFNTHTRQLKIPYTGNDQTLLPYVRQLFTQLYDRRLRIRLVGVRCTDLVHGSPQLSLFDHESKRLHLDAALDLVRRKFGEKSVQRAHYHGLKF